MTIEKAPPHCHEETGALIIIYSDALFPPVFITSFFHVSMLPHFSSSNFFCAIFRDLVKFLVFALNQVNGSECHYCHCGILLFKDNIDISSLLHVETAFGR